MSNAGEIGIQARTLLNNVEHLLSVVDAPNSPLARHLSEPRLGLQVFECRAIHKSLTQFSEAASGLRYVGFIGHFSAGKSSTINSLLGSERDVGLHPTDTGITFITHPRNQRDVIGSSGARTLGVGAFFFETPSLLDFVFVDTPGSGDPNIVSELVREFLPVCDRIVYMISATQPFTEAEIPILKRASEELAFVPVTFVVTRADEFRRDTKESLSVANIDMASQQDFLRRLRERLSENLPNLRFDANDVFIIDNRSGYGIPDLRSHLTKKSAYPEDIPAKKIEYFARRIDRAKSAVYRYAAEHLAIASSLALASEANARKYEEDISVSINHLRREWKQIEDEFEKYRSTTQASISRLRHDGLAGKTATDITELVFDEEAKGNLMLAQHKDALVELADEIGARLNEAAQRRLRKFEEGLREALRLNPRLGVAEQFMRDFNADGGLALPDEDKVALANQADAAASIILSRLGQAICDRFNGVRRSVLAECATVEGYIEDAKLLEAEEGLFDHARNSMFAAVRSAASSVAVYATALQASPNWLSSLFKLKIADELAAAVTNVIPVEVQSQEADRMVTEFFATRQPERDALRSAQEIWRTTLAKAASECPAMTLHDLQASNMEGLRGKVASALLLELNKVAAEETAEAIQNEMNRLVSRIRDVEAGARSATQSMVRQAKFQSFASRGALTFAGILGGLGPFLVLACSPLSGLRWRWWVHALSMVLLVGLSAYLSIALADVQLTILETGSPNFMLMGGITAVGGLALWLVTVLLDDSKKRIRTMLDSAFSNSLSSLGDITTLMAIKMPRFKLDDAIASIDKSQPILAIMREHEEKHHILQLAADKLLSLAKIRTAQVESLDVEVQKFLGSLRSWYGENVSKVERCNLLVAQWRVGAVEPSLKVVQNTEAQLKELADKVA